MVLQVHDEIIVEGPEEHAAWGAVRAEVNDDVP